MYLFRIHIRPGGGEADMPTTFAYCLKHGFLGVGWRVNFEGNTKDWESYYAVASEEHGKLHICQYIKDWVSEGDLVWTRDSHGQYYLARVSSGWEYWSCDEAGEKDIDIANIFRCDIRRVHIDAVPGKVVACFRAPKTIQEVKCDSTREYSKFLWNVLADSEVYQIDDKLCSDVFMLLDDEETEDLLFLFLQSKGWYVIPNSRKKDTMSFEYLVVRPESGEIAAAQVKTGRSTLNRDDYVHLPHKVFLFQANDLYKGSEAANVSCVSRKELRGFLSEARSWLPEVLRTKLSLAEQGPALTRKRAFTE